MQTRSTVMVRNAAVTSSHQLASYHGSRTLDKGGNIFDALIATSSVLTVVQNNLNGLGGDLFALVRGKDGKIRDLNGSGRSSENASIEAFWEKGVRRIPERGPLAAITVPGIVEAWREINSKYGTMEISELLRPAIDIAENGYPLTGKYVNSIKATSRVLGNQKGWTSLFMPGGKAPEPGEMFRQKHLAATLREIAEEGPESFYKGQLMERIVKGIQENDGILDEEDFRKHYSDWREPLKASYRGVDIYNTYPNSQGATVNLWVNMLNGYDGDLMSQNEEKTLPVFLETGLKAYMARSRYITDPEYHDLPQGFSTPSFAQKILEEPLENWKSEPGNEDKGDTTYFCLADAEGNSASVIQSNFMGFGSGLSPTDSGFILQNRGSYFSLNRDHHNSLEPHKRTFHTLLATMGITDGELSFVSGTMGGDIQPQVNIQMINRLVDRRMDVQDVLDYPRWAFYGTIYEKPSSLSVEHSLMDTIRGVDTGSLPVKEIPDLTSQTGHAQAIVLGKKGGIYAGADPRGDGAAVGF